jgi:membrane fusion protein (multidrug efflux system)
MKYKKRVVYLGGAVLLLLALAAYRIFTGGSSTETRRQNTPFVKVETLRRDTVVVRLRFTGDIVPIQQAGIFSKVSGNLERVYVDMGMRVGRGQLLARIDTTELHQQYQQAQATYENARLTYQRTKDLFEQNLVAKQDLDNAGTTQKIAAAAYETAQTRLRYAWITAPFSGYITKRFLDVGALVTTNNSTLFTLMTLDEMKVLINVLERDIPLIQVGKKAIINIDAYPGREFFGRITRFSQAVDFGTRTMAVEIVIPNPDLSLKPGMFANVMLILDQHLNAFTLPTAALLKDDTGPFVYIASSDSARRVRVTPGVEQDGRTEIISGLDPSSLVITTGQQLVRANGPIQVQR